MARWVTDDAGETTLVLVGEAGDPGNCVVIAVAVAGTHELVVDFGDLIDKKTLAVLQIDQETAARQWTEAVERVVGGHGLVMRICRR